MFPNCRHDQFELITHERRASMLPWADLGSSEPGCWRYSSSALSSSATHMVLLRDEAFRTFEADLRET